MDPLLISAWERLSETDRRAAVAFFNLAAAAPGYPVREELEWQNPPAGIGPDAWWAALKLAREATLQDLPFELPDGSNFRVGCPESTRGILHDADRGRLAGGTVAERSDLWHELAAEAALRESVAAVRLDDPTVEAETAIAALRRGRRPRSPTERRIRNYHSALLAVRASASDDPLTPDRLLYLARLLSAGPGTAEDRSNGAIAAKSAKLGSLAAFANGTPGGRFLHPVARAGVVHFWVRHAGLFGEASGTMARLLFLLCAHRSGYREFELLAPSEELAKDAGGYERALNLPAIDGNDVTYFVCHLLRVLRQAGRRLEGHIVTLTGERRRLVAQVPDGDSLNVRQQALLAEAMQRPDARFLIESHRRGHGIVFQTARDDLFDLVDRGIFVAEKVGRATEFRLRPDRTAELAGGDFSAAVDESEDGLPMSLR